MASVIAARMQQPRPHDEDAYKQQSSSTLSYYCSLILSLLTPIYHLLPVPPLLSSSSQSSSSPVFSSVNPFSSSPSRRSTSSRHSSSSFGSPISYASSSDHGDDTANASDSDDDVAPPDLADIFLASPQARHRRGAVSISLPTPPQAQSSATRQPSAGSTLRSRKSNVSPSPFASFAEFSMGPRSVPVVHEVEEVEEVKEEVGEKKVGRREWEEHVKRPSTWAEEFEARPFTWKVRTEDA